MALLLDPSHSFNEYLTFVRFITQLYEGEPSEADLAVQKWQLSQQWYRPNSEPRPKWQPGCELKLLPILCYPSSSSRNHQPQSIPVWTYITSIHPRSHRPQGCKQAGISPSIVFRYSTTKSSCHSAGLADRVRYQQTRPKDFKVPRPMWALQSVYTQVKKGV